MSSAVKIYQESLPLKTYQVGPADREPPLIREFTPRNQPIYPYSTQELLTSANSVRHYTAIILENDYLKLTVLPELNGRLYSAFDKIHQKELFYANRVIRPGLFGLRGAWPAVGVEFNFPNSHTVTTMAPVHCHTRQHPDGAAEIVVGDLECVSRMSWQAAIKLQPDSSAIAMRSCLFNPTDYPRRYYYWINAACPVYPETEFIYPPATRRLLTHPPMDASRLGYLNWPAHHGVDVRYFKNIRQHLPVFAEHMPEDFYGIYHHHLDYGLVHLADRNLVRGRKLWMFGTARDGRIFIEQLSDDGTDYCELQTGPFSLQSDYRLLPPGGRYVQNDLWLPVAKTGGFNCACRQFAARIGSGADAAIRVCAAEPLHGLEIWAGRRQVGRIEAAPGETCVLAGNYAAEELTFRASGGEVVAVYRPAPPRVNARTIPAPAARPVRCGCLLGKYLEEQDYPAQAEAVYLEHARKERGAMLAAARLAMRRGLWELARERLAALLVEDSRHAEALIYSGILYLREQDYASAERQFSIAADDNQYRARALEQLARGAVMQGEYRRALEILDGHGALAALCRRKLNLPAEAAMPDELSPLALGEEFFSAGRLDWPAHAVMESVCAYLQLRHYSDALTLLEQAVSKKAACHYYVMAWLKSQLHEDGESAECLKKARQPPWGGVFPYGRETEDVLRWALQQAPDDHAAHYHLGCLLASDDRWDEAAECWRKVRHGRHYGDAQRGLGLYRWKILRDLPQAVGHYQAALAGNASAKTVTEAALLLDDLGDSAAQLKLFDRRTELIERDCRIKLAYIRALLASHQPEHAARLLEQGEFRLSEGKKTARELYVQTFRQLAEKAASRKEHAAAAEFYLQAADYPENIGIGRPAGNCDAESLYLAGQAYLLAGMGNKARACFELGAARGGALQIDFFPLRNLIWEAPAAGAMDQTNEKFMNLCRAALRQTPAELELSAQTK